MDVVIYKFMYVYGVNYIVVFVECICMYRFVVLI